MRSRSESLSRLGAVLRAAIDRLPIAQRLADGAVLLRWDEAVGETIARHAQPLRLRGRTLVVAVDGPEWMQELQFLKHDLCAKLNARVGREAVRDIFLVLDGG